ncbi:MAG: right-handed parallel beta-helix repeat-containing protein [Phycisphaerales bacterium]
MAGSEPKQHCAAPSGAATPAGAEPSDDAPVSGYIGQGRDLLCFAAGGADGLGVTYTYNADGALEWGLSVPPGTPCAMLAAVGVNPFATYFHARLGIDLATKAEPDNIYGEPIAEDGQAGRFPIVKVTSAGKLFIRAYTAAEVKRFGVIDAGVLPTDAGGFKTACYPFATIAAAAAAMELCDKLMVAADPALTPVDVEEEIIAEFTGKAQSAEETPLVLAVLDCDWFGCEHTGANRTVLRPAIGFKNGHLMQLVPDGDPLHMVVRLGFSGVASDDSQPELTALLRVANTRSLVLDRVQASDADGLGIVLASTVHCTSMVDCRVSGNAGGGVLVESTSDSDLCTVKGGTFARNDGTGTNALEMTGGTLAIDGVIFDGNTVAARLVPQGNGNGGLIVRNCTVYGGGTGFIAGGSGLETFCSVSNTSISGLEDESILVQNVGGAARFGSFDRLHLHLNGGDAGGVPAGIPVQLVTNLRTGPAKFKDPVNGDFTPANDSPLAEPEGGGGGGGGHVGAVAPVAAVAAGGVNAYTDL